MVVWLVGWVIQVGELKIGHFEGCTYEDTMLPLSHRRYCMFAVQRWLILITARSCYVSLVNSTFKFEKVLTVIINNSFLHH